MNIESFIINTNEKSITINFTGGNAACLSFEYLRVSTPVITKANQQTSLITNKKSVMLTAIENVGKHGYRFVFDDQHSNIYSETYLEQLINEQESRWQLYLSQLKNSGHSREATIDIQQL